MSRATFFSILASALAATLAGQVLLQSDQPGRSSQLDTEILTSNDDHTEWGLDNLPDPNATNHLVFDTVYSLLQHWPNTRMRNGHNIVPGIIPEGTLLYHGTDHNEIPSGPEWVSMDPEHSHYFCRRHFSVLERITDEGCYHLTLAAARPLKIVYFDGNSAAKLPYGVADTQDLLIWGESRPEDTWAETERAEDLCKWGRNIGVDGFVRMEMAFEVILCDFTSGVTVVSFPSIVRPGGTPPTMSTLAVFETLNAGSWHNRFPGETRVQLDLAGLVSFYDTQLVPSLITVRTGQERWDHRAQDVSDADLSAVVARLEATLTRSSDPSSGVDWRTLIQVVVDRYAGRLELTRHLLHLPATGPDELADLAKKVQIQLRIMLTPYLLSSATPTDPSDKATQDWTAPTYKLCSTTHTQSLEFELDSMTDSEKLLLRAVRGTSREICRVVTKMWAAGVYAGLDPSVSTKELLDGAEVSHVWNTWVEDLNQLLTWLDWSVWVKCNPDCGPEEMCFLPTWPFGFPRFPKKGRNGDRKRHSRPGSYASRQTSFDPRATPIEGFAGEMGNKPEPEWLRPQPKCIRRVDPY